jgi:excisionase family DNA binding protein
VEKLLTPREAASILGLTYPLKRWIYRGTVKSIQTLGGHHRVPESEIDRLIPQKPLYKEIEIFRWYLARISGRNQLIGRVLEVKYDGLVRPTAASHLTVVAVAVLARPLTAGSAAAVRGVRSASTAVTTRSAGTSPQGVPCAPGLPERVLP